MVNIEKNIIKLILLVLIGYIENINVFYKNVVVLFDVRIFFLVFMW